MRRAALFVLLSSFAIGVACVVNPQPLPPEAFSNDDDGDRQSADAGDLSTSGGTDSGSEYSPFDKTDASSVADAATPSPPDDASPSDASSADGGVPADSSVEDGGPADAALGG